MDLTKVLYSRRSVREYTSQAVDEEVIRQLIDAAVQAPSAFNQQPWLFTVVRDKTMLARISQQSKVHILKTSPASDFQQTLEDPEFHIFYHAPVLVVISAPSGPWIVEDCALAAENLMLAACAAGLGTCWIGFSQGWLGTPEGKSTIGLSDSSTPVAPIIVGHPRQAVGPVARKAPDIKWIG